MDIKEVTMATLRQRMLLLRSLAPPAGRKLRIVAARILLLLPLASPLVLGSALAAAQEPGVLRGTVSTAEKRPLPQARISIVGTVLAAVSDTDGTFRIGALPVGAQKVEVRLLGYATTLVPIQIESARDANLEVILSAVAISLEPVKVTADTLTLPEIRGFLLRRRRGNGKFLTRDEIDQMEARVFTDVLRRVPGMKIEPREGSFGPSYAVQSTRTEGMNGGRGCPVLFYVNGIPFPVSSDLEINHYVAPNEVAAVEIYTGASQIPAQFNSITLNARCGVIVIWTRIRTSANKSH
jgi:hypothetical protein